jgi:circadian clock protein KaiB
MDDVELTLFVTGETSQSREAISNIREICEETLGDYTLNVVDIQEHPRQAEREKIWATPTLIKEHPPPVQRVIGNFSRRQDVLLGLNLEIESGDTS